MNYNSAAQGKWKHGPPMAMELTDFYYDLLLSRMRSLSLKLDTFTYVHLHVDGGRIRAIAALFSAPALLNTRSDSIIFFHLFMQCECKNRTRKSHGREPACACELYSSKNRYYTDSRNISRSMSTRAHSAIVHARPIHICGHFSFSGTLFVFGAIGISITDWDCGVGRDAKTICQLHRIRNAWCIADARNHFLSHASAWKMLQKWNEMNM